MLPPGGLGVLHLNLRKAKLEPCSVCFHRKKLSLKSARRHDLRPRNRWVNPGGGCRRQPAAVIAGMRRGAAEAPAGPYVRWPTRRGRRVAFVAEEELWVVDLGAPESPPWRPTEAPGSPSSLRWSPCGGWLCFSCAMGGSQEVFACPSAGGPARRLTFLGAVLAEVVGVAAAPPRALFVSSARANRLGEASLWEVALDGSRAPRDLSLGPVDAVQAEPGGGPGLLLLRHAGGEASQWRGYRGGRAGELWLDSKGDGNFRLVFQGKGHGCFNSPMWLPDGGVAFVGDMDAGRGLYRMGAGADGEEVEDPKLIGPWPDLPRPRFASLDISDPSGPTHVTFTSGGSLWTGEFGSPPQRVSLPSWAGLGRWTQPYRSSREPLEDWSLHPEAMGVLTLTRGQAFQHGLWAGPCVSFPAAPIKSHKGRASSGGGPKSKNASVPCGRVRLVAHLFDGRRLALLRDSAGEEDVEIHCLDGEQGVRLGLNPKILGRPYYWAASPQAPLLAIVNHRDELLVLDAETGYLRLCDRTEHAQGIADLAWSPCGSWLAYSCGTGEEQSAIKILGLEKGPPAVQVTEPVLQDTSPSWDPDGRYLFFLSSREFEPVHDAVVPGAMAFPYGQRPYVLPLQEASGNPLLPDLRPPFPDEDGYPDGDDSGDDSRSSGASGAESDDEGPRPVEIDFEGIAERIVALPVRAGRYDRIHCVSTDLVLYTVAEEQDAPVGVGANNDEADEEDGWGLVMMKYNLHHRQEGEVMAGVLDFEVSMDQTTMLVCTVGQSEGEEEFWVCEPGKKPEMDGEDDDDSDEPCHGPVQMEGRAPVWVDPQEEWRQMLHECWRYMRDEAWTPGAVDWDAVFRKHAACLPRVATPGELRDLISEMLLDLGCSHTAVDAGGTEGEGEGWCAPPAFLGADLSWSDAEAGYRIDRIVRGDFWDPRRGGPLCKPGVGISVGDILVGIDKQPLSPVATPERFLQHKGEKEVMLSVRKPRGTEVTEPGCESTAGDTVNGGALDDSGDVSALESRLAALAMQKRKAMRSTGRAQKGKKGKKELKEKPRSLAQLSGLRHVRVRAASSEEDARYKDFVLANKSLVRELSGTRVGYIHVPDMERLGFSEFWSQQRAETRLPGLILDLRGNPGGNISPLLLDRLAQKSLSWQVGRRGSSVPGGPASARALVVLIDESTSSDAEVLAHEVRVRGLGELVGRTTWGGVAGYMESHELVDGTAVTVPQFCTWYGEVGGGLGFGLENRGVAPDVDRSNPPQAYRARRDEQLELAVGRALVRLDSTSDAEVPPGPLETPSTPEQSPSEGDSRGFRTWAPFELPRAQEARFFPRAGRPGRRAAEGGAGSSSSSHSA